MADNILVTDQFVQAVKEYLRPYEGYFHYQVMLNNHVDISRFDPWVQEADRYHPVSGSSVLSSGCGSAGDLQAFLQHGAAAAYGIEVEPGLARLARQRFADTEFESQVQIEVYDGLTLPYADKAFDIVFSIHVIEHTQDPDCYLIELCRVLKPGGIIFLDVPNRYYKYEQHTLIPYIHWPATRVRNVLLRFFLRKPMASRLSAQRVYQLTTHLDYHIPSPAGLLKVYHAVQAKYGLRLRAVFFHSYDGRQITYRAFPGKYFYRPIASMTTFRLVIEKLKTD
jgi:SAM-dependent methyltransferase